MLLLSSLSRFRWLKSTRVFAGSLLALATVSISAQIPGAFSIFCMPDPQYYTTSDHPSVYNLYRRQAQWITANLLTYNAKHVLWLGDLTNNNTLTQWNVASAAYTILDNAGMPYAHIPGNHDYQTSRSNRWTGVHWRDMSFYNAYLGAFRFAGKPWFGGTMPGGGSENNYTYFYSTDKDDPNAMKFLVVGLEFGPRKEVLTWANELISQHPDHRVIIMTHGYIGNNGAYVGVPGGSYAGMVGAGGADVYEECASRHSNVFLVLCGHVTESTYNTRYGTNGNVIYEMVIDYQSEQPKGNGSNLGNGWLRVLEFDVPSNRIRASTHTAAAGDNSIFVDGDPRFYVTSRYAISPTASDHLFSLGYNMTAAMQPYSYLNTSTAFHVLSAGDDLRSDQDAPSIGQAANGDWAVAWQDDHDNNDIYNIKVRGFDPDGNVRFQSSIVNPANQNAVNAIQPDIAMAADGRFVVAWASNNREIYARSYNADGTPVSPAAVEVTSVNTANGTVNSPSVAINSAGNFVVAWADDNDGNGSFQVKARGFSFEGAQRIATKTINSVASGQQWKPAIAMADNGDHVIVWEDNKDGTWDIGMRGFLDSGAEKFSQVMANSTLPGTQMQPDIAMKKDSGDFVVIWADDNDGNGLYEILARAFNADGTQRLSERTINVNSPGNQLNPSVDMDTNGNWYTAWEDNGMSGNGYQIAVNAFSHGGTRRHSSDLKVNTVTNVTAGFGAEARKLPRVSGHKSGRYIVAWADDMDGNTEYQVLARGMSGTALSLAVKSLNGTVTKSPEDAFYAPGTQVTLTPAPNPGYTFSGWTGDVPGGSVINPNLTVTMDASKRITANYAAIAGVGDWGLY